MKRLVFGLLATTVTATVLFAWPRPSTDIQAAKAEPAASVAQAPTAEAKPEPTDEPEVRVIESSRDGCGAWPYYKRSCLVAAKPAAEAPLPAPVTAAEPAAPGIPADLASQVGLSVAPVPTLPVAAAEIAPPAPVASAAPVPPAAPVAAAPAAAPADALEPPPAAPAAARIAARAKPAVAAKPAVQRQAAQVEERAARKKIGRHAYAELYDDHEYTPPFGHGRGHYRHHGWGHRGHRGGHHY